MSLVSQIIEIIVIEHKICNPVVKEIKKLSTNAAKGTPTKIIKAAFSHLINSSFILLLECNL